MKAFAGSAVITTILGSYLAMGEFFSEMLCGRSNVLACTSDECQSDWDRLGDMQVSVEQPGETAVITTYHHPCRYL